VLALDSFAEIGTRLANNFDARIIAADQPSDGTFTKAIAPLLPRNAIQLVEPQALELVAAIARSSVVVTDDPGIAQIASELSAPVIEIAGAGSAAAGKSPAHRFARSSTARRVSPDEVFEIASQMIQENRSASLFQRP
jgi:ADP-heptose:LPS heptosyltransferase